MGNIICTDVAHCQGDSDVTINILVLALTLDIVNRLQLRLVEPCDQLAKRYRKYSYLPTTISSYRITTYAMPCFPIFNEIRLNILRLYGLQSNVSLLIVYTILSQLIVKRRQACRHVEKLIRIYVHTKDYLPLQIWPETDDSAECVTCPPDPTS